MIKSAAAEFDAGLNIHDLIVYLAVPLFPQVSDVMTENVILHLRQLFILMPS